MVHSRFALPLIVVAVIHAASFGGEMKLDDFYEKAGTWRETISASLVKFAIQQKKFATLQKMQANDSGVPSEFEKFEEQKGVALSHWQTLPPFKDKGLGDACGPEDNLSTQPWVKKTDWKAGYVINLGMPDNSVQCCYCKLYVDAPRTVTAYLGSDDGIAVFLNGKKVMANDASRGAEPNQDKAQLELIKGINHLLLKIRNGGGPSGMYFSLDENPRGSLESGNSGFSESLWARLKADYPNQCGLIYAAYDWCRQDKLDIFMPVTRFEPKAKETLAQARNVLSSVVAAGGNAKLGDELKAMEGKCAATGADWRQLYFEVHTLRRRILLAHPAINFDKIIINRNPPTMYSHNGDQHLGRHSRVGPGLSALTNWKSDSPTIAALFEGKLPKGATRNPDMNYDADKVIFSFCDHTASGQKRYFLYEGAIDGSWVKQLTGTKRDNFVTWENRATVLIEDNDPAYMPDNNIVFISSRSQSYGRCHGGRYNPAMVLYKCDRNGDNIQQLSFGNENEYEPAILNDGRIIFTRWEYTDRHEMLFHKLWHCRPDGSHVAHYYGNDSLAPMMTTETIAIPGTHRVVATSMGHHSYSTGTTVVLDTEKGENGEAPVTHITPETPYSETHGWPNPHYSHPYPITENLFLVSRANHPVPPQGNTPPPNDRGIYLIDSIGSRELLYEEPSVASVSPIAVRKRQRPPVLPPLQQASKAESDTATVYVQNVYLTRNDPEGKIKTGSIKAIRINALGVQPRADRTPLLQNCPNGIPKKVLGTVPVDANGSACFKVPARTSLQMQILDENGMAILTEKSFFYLQPGENRSCIGCHEPVGSSPPPGNYSRSLVPVALTPPAGPQYKGGFSFMRTVQPVLDRHCISCHGLDETKKKDAAKDLSFIHDGKTWPQSYVEFVKRGEYRLGNKPYMEGEFNISRPYTFYAYSNKISHMLLKGHESVKMDRESLMRIFDFLDLNAQCYGDLFPNKLEDRQLDQKALSELRAYIKDLFGDKLAAQPDRALINVAQPDESRILMSPLASSAGGWGQIPGFKDKNDAKYTKMQQLVDKCILHAPNENTNGWQPTPEQGGSEKWIYEEQQKFLKLLSSK